MTFEEAVENLVKDLREALKDIRIAKKRSSNELVRSQKDLIVYWYKRTFLKFHCGKRILIRFQGRGNDMPLKIRFFQKEQTTAIRVIGNDKIREILSKWIDTYNLKTGIVGVC